MTVSFVGDGIYIVAIAWQTYDLSNAPSALAMVGIAWSLPQIVLLLGSGVLSDRIDRRHLMIAGDRDPRPCDRSDRGAVDHRHAHDAVARGAGDRIRGRPGAVRARLLGHRAADRPGGSARRGELAGSVRAPVDVDADRSAPRRAPGRDRRGGMGIRARRGDLRVLGRDDLGDPCPAAATIRGGVVEPMGGPEGGAPIRAWAAVVVGRDGGGDREPPRDLGTLGGPPAVRRPQRAGWLGGGARPRVRCRRPRGGLGGARDGATRPAPEARAHDALSHVGARDADDGRIRAGLRDLASDGGRLRLREQHHGGDHHLLHADPAAGSVPPARARHQPRLAALDGGGPAQLRGSSVRPPRRSVWTAR